MINVLPDSRSIQMLSEPRMNSHEAIGITLLGVDLIGKSAPARIDPAAL
jgi:hypothetical protein